MLKCDMRSTHLFVAAREHYLKQGYSYLKRLHHPCILISADTCSIAMLYPRHHNTHRTFKGEKGQSAT